MNKQEKEIPKKLILLVVLCILLLVLVVWYMVRDNSRDSSSTAAANAAESAAMDYEVSPSDKGLMQAATEVTVYSLPTTDSEAVGTLEAGEEVQVTGEVTSYQGSSTDFYEVIWSGGYGYVKSSALTDVADEAPTDTAGDPGAAGTY